MSARSRAQAIGDAFTEPVSVSTPFGDVAIQSVEVHEDGPRSAVHVSVSEPEGGDPNFIVVNPPTLVPDPNGDQVVGGQTFREDPLAALAYAIGSNGGVRNRSRARG